jgi:hypothetical protein
MSIKQSVTKAAQRALLLFLLMWYNRYRSQKSNNSPKLAWHEALAERLTVDGFKTGLL